MTVLLNMTWESPEQEGLTDCFFKGSLGKKADTILC